MSSPFSLSVDGISDVISSLGSLSNELEAEVQGMLEQFGQNVFDDSQQLVHVRSGELKDSGHVVVERLNVSVEYDSDHAIFPEVGTIHMAASPYLFPPFENHSQQLMSDLKALAE